MIIICTVYKFYRFRATENNSDSCLKTGFPKSVFQLCFIFSAHLNLIILYDVNKIYYV